MDFVFRHPMPATWLISDVIVILVSLILLVYVIKKSKHPAVLILECFAFIFLYASLYENAAGAASWHWYIFGKSLLMVGDVPLTVPIIEIDVVILGLWLLDKMDIPTWCKPFIVGLFGMLQDFTLDPLAVKQIYTVDGVTTGRWTWLIGPDAVNIYGVPVYNFAGWMLILGLASTFILLGRWWFKKSGYKPVVGYVYPFLAMILALGALMTPLSTFLLWAGPFYHKGGMNEWVMLGVNLAIPAILLAVFWRGRMKGPISFKDAWPIFAVPIVLHLSDIIFTIVGGHTEILWLVLLISAVNIALLLLIYFRGRSVPQHARVEAAGAASA